MMEKVKSKNQNKRMCKTGVVEVVFSRTKVGRRTVSNKRKGCVRAAFLCQVITRCFPPQVSLCVLLLRYQPEGDIHGFVNFLSEEQNNKRKEGVLAECEKDACSPTTEADEYGGLATNTCGAKNLPSLGDNEMLIGKPDKTAYTASHPNYGTVDMTTGIEAEESEGGMTWRLKKLIGPRYYTLRIRLGLPGKMDRPTAATGKTVTVCVLLLFIFDFAFCSFIIFGEKRIE